MCLLDLFRRVGVGWGHWIWGDCSWEFQMRKIGVTIKTRNRHEGLLKLHADDLGWVQGESILPTSFHG